VLSSDPNPAARRGYTLALGHLAPNVFFRQSPSLLTEVVTALIKATEIEVFDKSRSSTLSQINEFYIRF
jgi:hypothetical protein